MNKVILIIFSWFLSAGFLFGAVELTHYEMEDSNDYLKLRFNFFSSVPNYKVIEQKSKRRHLIRIPKGRSRFVKGRQDLDHLLGISFHVKNRKKYLDLVIYPRGPVPIEVNTLNNKKTIEVTFKNFYPRREELDPEGDKYVVCIDPGHGYPDPGAEGKNSTEAQINLLVAKQLKKELSSRAGVVAFLTRETDYKIKLEDRPKISDRASADVFLSLHLNAFMPKIRGFEIYFLSEAGATQSVQANVSTSDSVQDSKEQSSKNILNKIILDMQKNSTVNISSLLAQSVSKEMGKIKGLRNRGVNRAAFVVLKTIKTPSILIEQGFITNLQDEKYFLSKQGQEEASERITDGIIKFLNQQNLRPKLPNLVEPRCIVTRVPKEIPALDFYKVKPGDTLIKIAQIYNISYKSIMSANPGLKPSRIPVGKKLKIPVFGN
jgi:N-acetylmuramoyl-L-alanine amidase